MPTLRLEGSFPAQGDVAALALIELAHEHSSVLVEGLATLRPVLSRALGILWVDIAIVSRLAQSELARLRLPKLEIIPPAPVETCLKVMHRHTSNKRLIPLCVYVFKLCPRLSHAMLQPRRAAPGCDGITKHLALPCLVQLDV